METLTLQATTVASLLAKNIPAVHQCISDAVREHSDIANQSLRDQWHQLVLRPLLELKGSGSPSYVLVVDALDECGDDNNVRIIVQLLTEVRSIEPVRLRVFLMSRSVVPIRCGFCQIPNAVHQDFVLYNVLLGRHFWIDEKRAYQELARRCIRLMSTSLKRDICGVDPPGVLVAEMDNSRVEHYFPLDLQHACLLGSASSEKQCLAFGQRPSASFPAPTSSSLAGGSWVDGEGP